MSTITNYSINKYLQGVNAFGAPFCGTIFTSTLGAGVEATVTTPSGAAMGAISAAQNTNYFLAVFSYQAAIDVWVAVNATAAVPAGNTFVASTSELNPPAKIVKAGDVIHMICAAAADVSVAFYAIQEN